MNRLPNQGIDVEGIVTEFLSKTLDERLDGIAPKAIRESRRAACKHERFNMMCLCCEDCGMTPHEKFSRPERLN